MKVLLLGDVHARDDVPLCRTDDYMEAQKNKFRYIKKVAAAEKAIIVQAGDLLDKWKPSPELLTICIEELPFMYTIAGNHDLPQHSKDLFYKSGLATLEAAGTVEVLRKPKTLNDGELVIYPFSWEDPLTECPEGLGCTLAVVHKLIWDKPPFPGADNSGNARAILRKLKGYDLILSGDNHEAFNVQRSGGELINPGSMMRMSSIQKEFCPRFYMWDTKSNEIERWYFPINEDAVSSRHIEVQNERNDRMDSFVQSVSAEIDLGLDFVKNVKKALQSSEVSENTKKVVREILDECNG